MTDTKTTPPAKGGEAPTAVLEDRPDLGDRGWRGLAADPGEKVAFLGAVGVIAVVAVATVLFGLPGLFLSGLLLTVVIMAVLLIISVGS